MLRLIPLVTLSITGVLALHQPGPMPVRRQSPPIDCASANRKVCGAVCIDPGDVCCPDNSGGCPSGTNCVLGSNNQYGCCPEGETCQGPGGAVTNTIPVQPATTVTNLLGHESSLAEQFYPTPTYRPSPPYPITPSQQNEVTSGSAPGTTTSYPTGTGTGTGTGIGTGTETGTGTGTGTAPSGGSTGGPVVPPNAAPANGLSFGILGGLLVGGVALLI